MAHTEGNQYIHRDPVNAGFGQGHIPVSIMVVSITQTKNIYIAWSNFTLTPKIPSNDN